MRPSSHLYNIWYTCEPVVDHILHLSSSSAAQSSKHSFHSWNAEEIGSASELIGLGVSARTFTGKQEGEICKHYDVFFCTSISIYHINVFSSLVFQLCCCIKISENIQKMFLFFFCLEYFMKPLICHKLFSLH